MLAAEDQNALWTLLRAIADADSVAVARLLVEHPELVHDPASNGATRQSAQDYFLEGIETYVFKGDTALHIAAATYDESVAAQLLSFGAAVQASNRRGQQPLHYSVVGVPGSSRWNPRSQSAVIHLLINAGADPDFADRDGVTPLHRAVRTRCSAAVRALLEAGADPRLANRRGSTPLMLAKRNSGRGSSGNPEARREQEMILAALQEHCAE
ncbi:MAG: ankyrin repeat domain-containing protein [Hyphomicrobiaceae bacterium]